MKSFNEIYEEICKGDTTNIEEAHKKYVKTSKRTSLMIVCLVLLFISLPILSMLNEQIFSLILFPCIVLMIILFIILIATNKNNTYKKIYKENIILPLVKNYDSNLSFDSNRSIPRITYNMAEFESYDNFYSNDYIYGNLDGIIPIELGDVYTESEHTDSDGNTTYSTVFRGLFSSIQLPQNLESTIKIHSDKGKLGRLFSGKDRVEMDSQEFEKHFDVFSNNKILAMRILTSDIMNYMISFKEENKVRFEITIKNSFIYVRIHCDDMFEPTTKKSAFDFDTLHKYYRFLNFICEINKKIYTTISNKDL